MTGISSRNFKMFRELCGESTLKNVVILTNMWGGVRKDVGEAREYELATQDIFFKPVLSKGASFLRHDNTRESALGILRNIIQNHPISLQIQRELDEGKDMSETAAGAKLNKELMIQIQKHRQEVRALQEEMKEAIHAKDEETRRELEAEASKLQAEMSRVQDESNKLASDYYEEKHKMEKRMQDISEESRRENEKAAAEYNKRLYDLREELSKTSSEAMQQNADLESQIERIRHSHHGGGGFFSNLGRAIDGVFGLL